MPKIRVDISVAALAESSPPTTFSRTISLPNTVSEPIRINSATFYFRHVRAGANIYIDFTCGTAAGRIPATGTFDDSGGVAVTRQGDMSFTNAGNILAQNGRTITFTTRRGSGSGTGWFGLYTSNAPEYYFEIDYELSTTAATAPTSVSVSPTLSEGNATLSWSGAAGGISNAIQSYEVQHRESTDNANWGSWAATGTVTTTATSGSLSVAPSGTRGTYRQYQVRTRGAAGASYYSGWRVSSNSLRRNQAPVAPASLTATPAIYESGDITITWPAGTDPDGNLSNYTVQYSTSTDASAWGAWANLGTYTARTITHAPTLARGSYIRYQVRSNDALGVSSGWRISGNVRRNSVPATPSFVFPANNQTVFTLTPTVRVMVGAEPDGQTQTLQISVNSGTWQTVQGMSASGGTANATPTLIVGQNTVTVRVLDSLNAASNTASRTITVVIKEWARAISTGVVIANTTISHQADITEMLTAVNTVRAYYGLTASTLPGTAGKWADWKLRIEALQTAIAACYTAAGKTIPTWGNVPAYPTAAFINAIRNAIKGV